MSFIADQMCFACGCDNPHGLHLTFQLDGDVYTTTFIPKPTHQGYQGIVHGGIMATLLDEIMARLVWIKAGPAATAKIAISYRHPASVGQPIIVRGWITAERRGGRAFEMAATAMLADGTLLAEATSLVLRITHATPDSTE